MAKGRVREVLDGKIFSSKSYGDFEVLEYLGNSRYVIRFTKTGTKIETTKHHIKSGCAMDRFYPSVSGVGFLGDKYNTTHFLCKRWSKMLSRCYNSESSWDYVNYGAKGITVCDRWHNFSNYVDDVILLEGYNEELVKSGKLHLDKDIINREAKIYSPETCSWVTQAENTKEMNRRTKQQPCIATRLSDNYSEEFYNITEFCDTHNLKCIDSVSTCLLGKRNEYSGWKFKYKESPIQYKQKNVPTNKSGYRGICKTSDDKLWRATAVLNHKQVYLGKFTDIKDAIIARYNWEVENQGVYRKPDSKDDYLKSIGYIKQKSAN